MPRDGVIVSPDHDRELSLGWLAVEWMEHWCVHGSGDVVGQPVELDDELAEFTVDCYALDRRGRRLYDSAVLSRPKGRDKSGHAARIALFEAFGPCRFAGWAERGEVFEWEGFTYRYRRGEPKGRPVSDPFVRCLATELKQAENTLYGKVLYNVQEGPLSELMARSDDAGKTRINLPWGGQIVPSTSGASSKDGFLESFAVFDETHLYVLPELRDAYATVRRNLRKRREAQPWSLETSTMYQAGEDSIAERSHAYADAINEGRAVRPRLLFDHREAPADVDLSDTEQIAEALRDVYGPAAEWMDIEGLVDQVLDPRNEIADSRRYLFNQRSAAADAWMLPHQWEAQHRPDATVDRTEPVVLGFDGSRRRSRGVTDATALVGCTVAGGHVFEVGVWEQPQGPAGDDWAVPVHEVLALVESTFARFNVVGFYADPNKWESHVAAWEARWGKQLKAKATIPHPIEWWPNRARLMVQATGQFHDAVLDGELTWAGATLGRHVTNAHRRSSRAGIQIGKEHPDSPRKIDAAVAAILAWQARLDAISAGALNARKVETHVPYRIR